jgi:hypothetical protein
MDWNRIHYTRCGTKIFIQTPDAPHKAPWTLHVPIYFKTYVNKMHCGITDMWLVMPYDMTDRYKRFGRKRFLYLQHIGVSLFWPTGRNISFFWTPWGGVRLAPLSMSAIIRILVPAPVDTWWWLWRSRCNEGWQGKLQYSDKTCPSAILSTINPIWPDLVSNPAAAVRRWQLTTWAMERPGIVRFLRNVSTYLPVYMASHARRP